MAPLEELLTNAKVLTIVYVSDRSLRYVPLAALNDGKQWLIERFKIHRITSATLSDLSKKPVKELNLLAGAYGTTDSEVDVGGEPFLAKGLPFARAEVEGLARIIAGSRVLLGSAFDPVTIEREAHFYTVIHLATHAAFVVGQPGQSFILFNNGHRLTLKEVQGRWLNLLGKANLIVLSACETGIGGRDGNGEEILGFGYLMEQAGADASVATLWSVDDGGTQILMAKFYEVLLKQGTSKADALQQAQIALIRSDEPGSPLDRGVGLAGEVVQFKGRLSHPYYWAPFILIGNGL